jgi:hypothetical protein
MILGVQPLAIVASDKLGSQIIYPLPCRAEGIRRRIRTKAGYVTGVREKQAQPTCFQRQPTVHIRGPLSTPKNRQSTADAPAAS